MDRLQLKNPRHFHYLVVPPCAWWAVNWKLVGSQEKWSELLAAVMFFHLSNKRLHQRVQ
jgi:hypothetical protein